MAITLATRHMKDLVISGLLELCRIPDGVCGNSGGPRATSQALDGDAQKIVTYPNHKVTRCEDADNGLYLYTSVHVVGVRGRLAGAMPL
jgi:hypothetical protein